MRIINDYHSKEPYFNLAAEEYFLLHSTAHICRFWQNENAVIIGKHQALPAEVNTKTASERNIKIARRISGGGTVYHDQGNLNFSFLHTNPTGENKIDFQQFTQPIIDALAELGLSVQHSGRNDLLLNDLKISGNAEHLAQKLSRTLHHGTLLFNSNLSNLGAVLKTPINSFEGKFVQSKRSKVTNILPHLAEPMIMKDFRAHLVNYFIKYHGAQESNLTPLEINAITALAREKYHSKSWIYGYSPKFVFNGLYKEAKYSIQVEKGKIIGYHATDEALEIALKRSIGLYFCFSDLQKNSLLCNLLF